MIEDIGLEDEKNLRADLQRGGGLKATARDRSHVYRVVPPFRRNGATGSIAHHVPEWLPMLAVEPYQLHLTNGIIVRRRRVHRDAWQHKRRVEPLQVGRLAHDVLACEVIPALLEHLYEHRAVSVVLFLPNDIVLVVVVLLRSACC